MSPADGAAFDIVSEKSALIPDLAIILPGGRTLLAVSSLDDALPRSGSCGDFPWRALCWPALEGRAGLALVEAPLLGTWWLRSSEGKEREIASPRVIDVAAAPLAEFVRRHGLNTREVFDFLVETLVMAWDKESRCSNHAFAVGFLSLAAEAGGFVEILACPDTGGLFAQGWAMSLPVGRHALARLDGTLKLCDADVAVFSRDDILSPAMGFCIFSLDWPAPDLETLDCLFYEEHGTLKRLEVVRGNVLRLNGEAATEHVRQMVPRLICDDTVRGLYQRICRPRYRGLDTLSSTSLPVAAAFDALFETPSGELLVLGWLLDPLRRVDRVIIKSASGLYAALQECWHPIARADLNHAFSGDARFARLLETANTMHGFIAFAVGRARKDDEDLYLELVLDDATCLFRPVKSIRLDGRELLPQILSAMPMQDPALEVMIDDTLAPFLAALPTPQKIPRKTQRPIPLSAEAGEITAVVPLSHLNHLQPMIALLSGTPEAARLDLVIVMTRSDAVGAAPRLKDLFSFYEIRGRMVLIADNTDFCARIEAGLALASGPRVLLWLPSALPSTPGWLGLLEDELEGLGTGGLISPMLVYEDGSIFYGGDGVTDKDSALMLGYPINWMVRGAPCPMQTGAAQFALIDRHAMIEAGGFSGGLYSNAMVHRDLAHRLHAHGFGTWSSRSVDFWMLEDLPQAENATMRLLERVDSVLIANTGPAVTKGRFV